MDEEEKDNEWYSLGHISQLEIEAKKLIEKSGELFVRDKIDLANYTKSLGKEMEDRAKKLRESHDTKYPK